MISKKIFFNQLSSNRLQST